MFEFCHQCVFVGGRSFRKYPSCFGCSSGVTLGPLLFLIFINYVSSSVEANTRTFADN